jgi:hypothetical protein
MAFVGGRASRVKKLNLVADRLIGPEIMLVQSL